MLMLFALLVYGIIVGYIARAIHPGDDSASFLETIGIGIAGSFVGGFINFLFFGGAMFRMSGLIMGVVGGVLFLAAWRWYKLNNAVGGPRRFLSGKKK